MTVDTPAMTTAGEKRVPPGYRFCVAMNPEGDDDGWYALSSDEKMEWAEAEQRYEAQVPRAPSPALSLAQEALRQVRGIIAEGAVTGFNPLQGDWADRLFASQQVTARALSAAPGDSAHRERMEAEHDLASATVEVLFDDKHSWVDGDTGNWTFSDTAAQKLYKAARKLRGLTHQDSAGSERKD